jgi:hypothetical protein
MRWIKRCRIFRGCCWHFDEKPIKFPIPQSTGCQQPVPTEMWVRTCCLCKQTQGLTARQKIRLTRAYDLR